MEINIKMDITIEQLLYHMVWTEKIIVNFYFIFVEKAV